MRVYAGIDGGGTKSRMLVTDENKQIICETLSGTTNICAADIETVAANLNDLFRQAEEKAGTRLTYKGIGLGTAGAGRKDAVALLTGIIRKATDCDNIFVVGDMLLPLYAFSPENGSNVQIVIAGTGSICYGINADGQTARSGGWGHLIGDEGGAYWLACRGLDACLRAYDGRSKNTALTELMLRYFACKTPLDLVSTLYAEPFSKSRIAKAAVCVAEAADGGDETAITLLREVAAQLLGLVNAVARTLGPPDAVLFGGGLLNKNVMVQQYLHSLVIELYSAAKIVLTEGLEARKETDAAWGAVKLAAGTINEG